MNDDLPDDLPDDLAGFPPGGAIPPGVLDPSIVRISADSTSRWSPVVSTESPLALSSRAFFARYSRVHFRPLNSIHYSTFIPRRDPYGLGVPMAIPPELRELIPEERIEALLHEFNPELEEGEQRMAIMGWMMERTPQFTLRNVMRAIRDVNPKMPDYQIEVWRYDDANPALQNVSSQTVYSYESPEIDIETSSKALQAERDIRDGLLVHANWLDEWGRWWEKTGKPNALRFIIPPDYFTMPRVRGRFATPEEAEEERKDRQQTRSVEFSMDNPDGVWS